MSIFKWYRSKPARLRPRKRTGQLQRLEDRRLLAADGFEQEFVYLLNRARHDPTAYQAEQSLPISLAGVTPRGPVAANDALFSSSDVKAADMATNNYFSHTSPAGVEANRLARDAGYPLPDLYPDNMNFIESIAGGTDKNAAIEVLNLLVIDEGFPTFPHRKQLFSIESFNVPDREIGVGFVSSTTSAFTNYWAVHIARRQEPMNFLTGVVFDDLNADGRYQAGEGLSGVTITVDGTTTVQTNAGGGWSVPASDGEHSVHASGGGFVGYSTATANVAGENVEVDFISGRASSQVAFDVKYAKNPNDRYDVNSQGGATANDALVVINHVGRVGGGGASVFQTPTYLDVNGDGNASILDALQVINEVTRRTNSAGGEVVLSQLAAQKRQPNLDEVDASLMEWISELSTENPQSSFPDAEDSVLRAIHVRRVQTEVASDDPEAERGPLEDVHGLNQSIASPF